MSRALIHGLRRPWPPRYATFSCGIRFASSGPRTHYQVLGVTPSASRQEIKDAFFTLSKENHPDLNPDHPEAAEKFQAVVEAYDVLADPEKKRDYDRALGVRRPRSTLNWQPGQKRRDPEDEWGRQVDVDLSQKNMNRAWGLYKERWKAEEARLNELEELKVAFRINMDRRRDMFQHLSKEEQVEFREACRLFRHPEQWAHDREVVRPDKENAEAKRPESLFVRILSMLGWGRVAPPDPEPATPSRHVNFSTTAPLVSGSKRKSSLGSKSSSTHSSTGTTRATKTSKLDLNQLELEHATPPSEPRKPDPAKQTAKEDSSRSKAMSDAVDFDPEEIVKASQTPNFTAFDPTNEVERHQRARQSEMDANLRRKQKREDELDSKMWSKWKEAQEHANLEPPPDPLERDRQARDKLSLQDIFQNVQQGWKDTDTWR